MWINAFRKQEQAKIQNWKTFSGEDSPKQKKNTISLYEKKGIPTIEKQVIEYTDYLKEVFQSEVSNNFSHILQLKEYVAFKIININCTILCPVFVFFNDIISFNNLNDVKVLGKLTFDTTLDIKNVFANQTIYLGDSKSTVKKFFIEKASWRLGYKNIKFSYLAFQFHFGKLPGKQQSKIYIKTIDIFDSIIENRKEIAMDKRSIDGVFSFSHGFKQNEDQNLKYCINEERSITYASRNYSYILLNEYKKQGIAVCQITTDKIQKNLCFFKHEEVEEEGNETLFYRVYTTTMDMPNPYNIGTTFFFNTNVSSLFSSSSFRKVLMIYSGKKNIKNKSNHLLVWENIVDKEKHKALFQKDKLTYNNYFLMEEQFRGWITYIKENIFKKKNYVFFIKGDVCITNKNFQKLYTTTAKLEKTAFLYQHYKNQSSLFLHTFKTKEKSQSSLLKISLLSKEGKIQPFLGENEYFIGEYTIYSNLQLDGDYLVLPIVKFLGKKCEMRLKLVSKDSLKIVDEILLLSITTKNQGFEIDHDEYKDMLNKLYEHFPIALSYQSMQSERNNNIKYYSKIKYFFRNKKSYIGIYSQIGEKLKIQNFPFETKNGKQIERCFGNNNNSVILSQGEHLQFLESRNIYSLIAAYGEVDKEDVLCFLAYDKNNNLLHNESKILFFTRNFLNINEDPTRNFEDIFVSNDDTFLVLENMFGETFFDHEEKLMHFFLNKKRFYLEKEIKGIENYMRIEGGDGEDYFISSKKTENENNSSKHLVKHLIRKYGFAQSGNYLNVELLADFISNIVFFRKKVLNQKTDEKNGEYLKLASKMPNALISETNIKKGKENFRLNSCNHIIF